MAFPPLGNSDHVFVSVSTDFPTTSKWDVPWCFNEDIFKPSASAIASEFCERVQVGIDAYIPYHKYHVNPHSPHPLTSPAAAIVDRNHFFRL